MTRTRRPMSLCAKLSLFALLGLGLPVFMAPYSLLLGRLKELTDDVKIFQVHYAIDIDAFYNDDDDDDTTSSRRTTNLTSTKTTSEHCDQIERALIEWHQKFEELQDTVQRNTKSIITSAQRASYSRQRRRQKSGHQEAKKCHCKETEREAVDSEKTEQKDPATDTLQQAPKNHSDDGENVATDYNLTDGALTGQGVSDNMSHPANQTLEESDNLNVASLNMTNTTTETPGENQTVLLQNRENTTDDEQADRDAANMNNESATVNETHSEDDHEIELGLQIGNVSLGGISALGETAHNVSTIMDVSENLEGSSAQMQGGNVSSKMETDNSLAVVNTASNETGASSERSQTNFSTGKQNDAEEVNTSERSIVEAPEKEISDDFNTSETTKGNEVNETSNITQSLSPESHPDSTMKTEVPHQSYPDDSFVNVTGTENLTCPSNVTSLEEIMTDEQLCPPPEESSTSKTYLIDQFGHNGYSRICGYKELPGGGYIMTYDCFSTEDSTSHGTSSSNSIFDRIDEIKKRHAEFVSNLGDSHTVDTQDKDNIRIAEARFEVMNFDKINAVKDEVLAKLPHGHSISKQLSKFWRKTTRKFWNNSSSFSQMRKNGSLLFHQIMERCEVFFKSSDSETMYNQEYLSAFFLCHIALTSFAFLVKSRSVAILSILLNSLTLLLFYQAESLNHSLFSAVEELRETEVDLIASPIASVLDQGRLSVTLTKFDAISSYWEHKPIGINFLLPSLGPVHVSANCIMILVIVNIVCLAAKLSWRASSSEPKPSNDIEKYPSLAVLPKGFGPIPDISAGVHGTSSENTGWHTPVDSKSQPRADPVEYRKYPLGINTNDSHQINSQPDFQNIGQSTHVNFAFGSQQSDGNTNVGELTAETSAAPQNKQPNFFDANDPSVKQQYGELPAETFSHLQSTEEKTAMPTFFDTNNPHAGQQFEEDAAAATQNVPYREQSQYAEYNDAPSDNAPQFWSSQNMSYQSNAGSYEGSDVQPYVPNDLGKNAEPVNSEFREPQSLSHGENAQQHLSEDNFGIYDQNNIYEGTQESIHSEFRAQQDVPQQETTSDTTFEQCAPASATQWSNFPQPADRSLSDSTSPLNHQRTLASGEYSFPGGDGIGGNDNASNGRQSTTGSAQDWPTQSESGPLTSDSTEPTDVSSTQQTAVSQHSASSMPMFYNPNIAPKKGRNISAPQPQAKPRRIVTPGVSNVKRGPPGSMKKKTSES